MSTRGKSRRSFLIESAAGLSGAWVAANYSGILAAEEYVLHAAQSGKPVAFQFFTPDQAVEIEAMAAQIIPTDETPGAREAPAGSSRPISPSTTSPSARRRTACSSDSNA